MLRCYIAHEFEGVVMDDYDPSRAINPSEWLALPESDRIDMVYAFHEDSGEENQEGSETMHATIHVLVENQIALGVEPVPQTIAKLLRQGLNRHDAIHAVGAVLSGDIFNLMNKSDVTWDQTHYSRRLTKLTAKRWRKGQW